MNKKQNRGKQEFFPRAAFPCPGLYAPAPETDAPCSRRRAVLHPYRGAGHNIQRLTHTFPPRVIRPAVTRGHPDNKEICPPKPEPAPVNKILSIKHGHKTCRLSPHGAFIENSLTYPPILSRSSQSIFLKRLCISRSISTSIESVIPARSSFSYLFPLL